MNTDIDTLKPKDTIMNTIKKFFNNNPKTDRVVVMPWPCKENPDKSFGRSGYESLYK